MQGQDCLGQQIHYSPYIHLRYVKRSQIEARDNGFFFCNDNIERCVKGTKKKWVQSRLDIPSIWPVKIGTNLSKKEILQLESAGFQLPQRAIISPRRLFGMEELPFSLASFPTPANVDDFPNTRSGKSICRNNNAPNIQQANNCASSLTLKGQIRKVTMIPHPEYGCIVTLKSGAPPRVQQYYISPLALFRNTLVRTSKIWQQSLWANMGGGQVASIFILFLLS